MTIASCHLCGYKVDSDSGLFEDHRPLVGDLSICLNCGELAAFTPEMTLREVTVEERAALSEPALLCQFAIRYRGRLRRR